MTATILDIVRREPEPMPWAEEANLRGMIPSSPSECSLSI